MAPAWRLRLFYFLYYGNVGAFLPFFALYLRGLGFTGEQIGAAKMLPPLLAPAVALAWATWADRGAGPARALRRAAAWAGLCAVALPAARTPWAIGLVLAVEALGDRAVIPLVDSTALEWCRADPAHAYARIRLFGSIGFAAAAVAVGVALAARGDRAGDRLVPVVVAALVVGYAAMAFTVPAPPAHGAPRPGIRDMVSLLRDRPFVVLVAASALHWAACAPYHLMFGVFVRGLGLSSRVTGVGMAVGVAAEVLALYAFPRLEGRVPARALFGVAFLGSALRWALLSRATTPGAVVSLQLLHGLTFGVFWGTAMKGLAATVPARLRATGQALFGAVVFGGGNALGYALSGLGYDRLGGVGPLFAWAAAIELVPLVLVWASDKKPQPQA